MHAETHDLAASLDALGEEIARAQPPLDPALRDRLIFAAGMSAGRARRRVPYGWASVTLGLVFLSLLGGKWWGLQAGAVDGPQMAANPAGGAASAVNTGAQGDSPASPKEDRHESPAGAAQARMLRPIDWMNPQLERSEPPTENAPMKPEADADARERILTPIRLHEILPSL